MPEWMGYDIGVADPTRIGRLPPGTPYYQRGHPSARMLNRKVVKYRSDLRKYGPLTSTVKYAPFILEATGGFSRTAADEFSVWAKEAAHQVKQARTGNYRAAGRPHTWNALKFANLYSQMLSFVVVKVTALSVVRATEGLARVD